MSAPFRKRGALHGWQLHFGPNMTPMVDVVMVILIFFMASTALVGPEWLLRVGLAPESQGEGDFELGPADLLVHIDVKGGKTVFTGFGSESQALAALESVANAAAQSLGSGILQTHITLEASSGVSYEAVVRVHDVLTEAGFPKIAIR